MTKCLKVGHKHDINKTQTTYTWGTCAVQLTFDYLVSYLVCLLVGWLVVWTYGRRLRLYDNVATHIKAWKITSIDILVGVLFIATKHDIQSSVARVFFVWVTKYLRCFQINMGNKNGLLWQAWTGKVWSYCWIRFLNAKHNF